MADIRTILCPVDFSEGSDYAAEYAVDLAATLGAKIELVHSYQLPMYALPDGALMTGPDFAATLSDNLQKELDQRAAKLGGRGVKIDTHLTEGVAHREIERLAQELGADMIIMGTHGRTGIQHMLLGSVAERTVRTASVPVLTVRQPE